MYLLKGNNMIAPAESLPQTQLKERLDDPKGPNSNLKLSRYRNRVCAIGSAFIGLVSPMSALAENTAGDFCNPVEREMSRFNLPDNDRLRNRPPDTLLPRYDTIESDDSLRHEIVCSPTDPTGRGAYARNPGIKLLTDLANPIPVRMLSARTNHIHCEGTGLFKAHEYVLYNCNATWDSTVDPNKQSAKVVMSSFIDRHQKGSRWWPLLGNKLDRPRKTRLLTKCTSSKLSYHQQAISIGFSFRFDIAGSVETQTLFSRPIYTDISLIRCGLKRRSSAR